MARARPPATLRAVDPQYRRLFDRNPHPMWVFDTRTLRFLAANDAAIRQYGYSRRELLTMTVRDVRASADVEDAWPAASAETGEPAGRLLRHRRKSGEIFEADVRSTPVRFRGRAAQLVVVIDVSRRMQAEREMKRHHAEQERRHLARELHDEIGQLLTGLKLTLQAIGKRDDAEDRGSAADASKIAWAEQLVDQLMRQIRELSLSLRPPALDDLGLLPALFTHLDHFAASTGVRVEFSHAGIDRRLSPDVETAAFRIVQEALTNVARHAGVPAAKLWVRLDADELCVIVEDEGRGIAPAGRAQATAGLDGMRERAALLGGRLIVDAPEAGGTRVTAILPL